jgi:homogentisate 1,2-dioxygenase
LGPIVFDFNTLDLLQFHGNKLVYAFDLFTVE